MLVSTFYTGKVTLNNIQKCQNGQKSAAVIVFWKFYINFVFYHKRFILNLSGSKSTKAKEKLKQTIEYYDLRYVLCFNSLLSGYWNM